jgi:2-keto-4-pentenoate hydratase/2-oxohepta-3-ene-1,7-dioic acid hydratase in catechol pathway
MKRVYLLLSLTLAVPSYLVAQDQPFKLGTFADGDHTYLGLVLNDSVVVDIAQANNALDGEKPVIPGFMRGLIERYDELRPRLGEIAAAASENGTQAAYVSAVSAVKILPPLTPNIIYNAASNYSLHAAEMARRAAGGAEPEAVPAPDPIPGIWERTPGDTRQNPYIFLKAAGSVIADGEAIRIPPQRTNLDWECELAAVIGRPASRVSPEDALDYIFGYTLENDVSDRGGRGDGRMGTDWFLQKNHDTFAPLGPFIVPKEFVADPHVLEQTLTLSGTVMQDSNTGNMTHDTFDMLSYISHIVTMRPGDVFAMGSPSGVGTARDTPIYMQAGDTAVCTIESIGTLTNPVVGPQG